MTTWESGSRDTTEFPELKVNVDGELRAHLDGFAQLDGVDLTDYEKQKTDSRLSVSDQRLRTYRKMYEQLGLLYPKNNKIALSRLGFQFKNLKSTIIEKRDELFDNLARSAIDILSRSTAIIPQVGPCCCYFLNRFRNVCHFFHSKQDPIHFLRVKLSVEPYHRHPNGNKRENIKNILMLMSLILKFVPEYGLFQCFHLLFLLESLAFLSNY